MAAGYYQLQRAGLVGIKKTVTVNLTSECARQSHSHVRIKLLLIMHAHCHNLPMVQTHPS